jgi:hypothetical protein
MEDVTHDTDYFRRRAAEARAAASSKDFGQNVEIAGELALAYSALARRRLKAAKADPEPHVEEKPAIPLES